MTQTQFLIWLVIVIASVSAIAIALTLAYLRHLREKIRAHRDVRRMVTEATPKNLELFDRMEAKHR
jgi:hypothetical protein